MTSKSKPTKIVHALTSPYSEPSWPKITPSLEAALLDNLIPLLSPIGAYRKANELKLKKRRNKKTKKEDNGQLHGNVRGAQDQNSTTTVQIQPAIQEFFTVGFNSTVRQLEMMSRKAHSTAPSQSKEDESVHKLVAVLICIADLPSIMTNPLPILAAMASRSEQPSHAIRIVPISNAGAERIAESLSQPRANILGILSGAPELEVSETLIRESVQPMEIPWISEAASQKYQPLKVHSEEIAVTSSKTKGEKRKRGSD